MVETNIMKNIFVFLPTLPIPLVQFLFSELLLSKSGQFFPAKSADNGEGRGEPASFIDGTFGQYPQGMVGTQSCRNPRCV